MFSANLVEINIFSDVQFHDSRYVLSNCDAMFLWGCRLHAINQNLDKLADKKIYVKVNKI